MPRNMLSTSPGGASASSGGRTAYGSVPASIATPPNIYSQLSGLVPNFGPNTSATGNVINSQLAGTVSPQTLNALKTASAQFGVASGMPGSGLEANQLFGNIAGFSEGQQQKGVNNLLAEAGTFGPTMTNPNLAAEIAARNADYAAAPDPRLAAEEQFNQWLKGFNITNAASHPSTGPWWAPGGVNTPPIGATVGRSYAPAGGGAFSTPDAFGYTFTNPEAGTIGPFGAINPTEPYQSTYNPTTTPTYPGMPSSLPPEWFDYMLGSGGGDQGFESSEYGGG